MKTFGKKVIFGALLCMAFALTACGEDAKTIQGSVQTSAQAQADGNSQTPGDAGQAEQETGGGYYFEASGVRISPDMNMASVLEKLGEPFSYFEAASCAFEGLDKIYTYTGYEIDTYPGKDGDYISAVILKDDTVSTPEGVSIADPETKVKDVYGEPAEQAEGRMVYEKGEMKLVFVVSDGKVASIEYDSKVMD